jgi:uncharacterized protein YukJ
MPLRQYGILKGNLFTPQEQTYQGNWFHGVFYVTIPGSTLPQRCVTDFSSATANNIQYKIFPNLKRDLFASILSLPDRYTDLARDPTSGALDYVRSQILGPYGCLEVVIALFNGIFGTRLGDGWIVSDGTTAVQALQQQLSLGPTKMYVFGEPFTDATPLTEDGIQSQNGMHNVHMNQGDPALSPDGHDHQGDDGIWQDGATIFENADGTLTAFCSKFVTQTFNTNDQGLPA